MMTPAGDVAPYRAKIRIEIPKVQAVRVLKGPRLSLPYVKSRRPVNELALRMDRTLSLTFRGSCAASCECRMSVS
jgi:hypothetical protein